MIPRAICLILGLVILGVGLARPSLALAVLASALVGLALVRVRDSEPAAPPAPEAGTDCSRASVAPRAVTVGSYALGLAAVAVALASTDTLIWLSVLAWLLAIGALIWLGLALDRLALSSVATAVRSLFSARHGPEVSSVLVIAGIALVLRFYDLELTPSAVHVDEGGVGRIALRIVTGERVPFFRADPAWGAIYPFAYLEALAIWLFGSTAASVRAVSALAGGLCVPVVYGIGRIGWGPVAGGMAAWLLAVSHLHIHYSRLGVSFMLATLLLATTVLVLMLAARQGRARALGAVSAASPGSDPTRLGLWTLLIAAGIVAGLSQHISHLTRIVPAIAGAALVLMLLRRWIGIRHIVVFGFAFLLVYAPLGAFFLENPRAFLVGIGDVSALRNWYVREVFGPEASLPSALPRLLVEHVRRTLGLFVAGVDRSSYYPGGPRAFDVVTAGLLWLGIGAVLSRLHRFHEIVLALWFGIGLVFGAALTLGADYGSRILLVTPAVYLFGGVALARVWELLRGQSLRRFDWLAAPVGTTLALWLVAANVVTYFFEYVPREEAAEATAMAREMRQNLDGYRYFFLTSPHYDPSQATVRYLASGLEATNLESVDGFKPPPADGRGVLILALPNHRDDLRTLAARLPGGEEREVLAVNGRLMYHRYEVPPTK